MYHQSQLALGTLKSWKIFQSDSPPVPPQSGGMSFAFVSSKKENLTMEKLKIFQKNKEYFRGLGIYLNTDTGKSHTFNRTILFGLFTFSLSLTADFIYIIFYEANTFWDLMQSIYFCYLTIDIPISYALLVFRAQMLLEFTVNIENVINESKLSIENFKKFKLKLKSNCVNSKMITFQKKIL